MTKAPLFQRRHYEYLACILQKVPESLAKGTLVDVIMRDLCKTNPRFDPVFFQLACEYVAAQGRDTRRASPEGDVK